MSRRHAAEKRKVLPEPKYGDVILAKFINNLMIDGKKYGLSFKIMHLEVEPVQRRSLKEYFENDAFVDSDDDSGEDTNDDTANTTTSTTPVLNTSALDNGNDNEESDDSDEEEENSDSSESEEEPVVAKKVSAKRGRKKKTLNASA